MSIGHTEVLVKDESVQPGGSFKDRGAGNAVLYHFEHGEDNFVTASAGNHGRGVARAATQSTVVVPSSASDEKKNAIKNLGAELVVHGGNFDEALNRGLEISKENKGVFVHPYKNTLEIAGQATIALEILDQSPDVTHVVLPVGGGGLLAGVASVIKEHKENIQVVAAQVAGNRAYIDSLNAGRPLQNQPIDTKFEGIAVGISIPPHST